MNYVRWPVSGINKPIGFKATKQAMCNVYYSFACLPSTSLKLVIVFLAYTVKALDVKSHGSNECFITLINTLKKMEVDDIEVETQTGKKIIHFILGLILEFRIYYSFPCLPSTSSKLDTVFLTCSVKTSDAKSHGSIKCFIRLINTLKKKWK